MVGGMTTSVVDQGWLSRLAAAGAAVRAAGDPQVVLDRACAALRVAWATCCAVRTHGCPALLWWLDMDEAVAAAADALDLVPGCPGVGLGLESAAPDGVADGQRLRAALADLLGAVAIALTGGVSAAAAANGDARVTLAATLAARSTMDAAARLAPPVPP
jgi:hypothetical protein